MTELYESVKSGEEAKRSLVSLASATCSSGDV